MLDNPCRSLLDSNHNSVLASSPDGSSLGVGDDDDDDDDVAGSISGSGSRIGRTVLGLNWLGHGDEPGRTEGANMFGPTSVFSGGTDFTSISPQASLFLPPCTGRDGGKKNFVLLMMLLLLE